MGPQPSRAPGPGQSHRVAPLPGGPTDPGQHRLGLSEPSPSAEARRAGQGLWRGLGLPAAPGWTADSAPRALLGHPASLGTQLGPLQAALTRRFCGRTRGLLTPFILW